MIITLSFLFVTLDSYSQDTTAAINFTWPENASDTSLTFVQIATICDSMFAQAVYTVFTDTLSEPFDTSQGSDTLQGSDSIAQVSILPDYNPFYDYIKWKRFWYTLAIQPLASYTTLQLTLITYKQSEQKSVN